MPTDRGSRERLVRILQDAHAGELAAAYAYRAHARSLRRRPHMAAEVRRIEAAEWHHRRGVAAILHDLGEGPRRRRELLMAGIGRFFGLLCHVTGRFGPMYAAGRLEAMNVGQYVAASRLAVALDRPDLAAELDAMVTEEARHEEFFGAQVRGHWMLRPVSAVLGWRPPPTDAAVEGDLPA